MKTAIRLYMSSPEGEILYSTVPRMQFADQGRCSNNLKCYYCPRHSVVKQLVKPCKYAAFLWKPIQLRLRTVGTAIRSREMESLITVETGKICRNMHINMQKKRQNMQQNMHHNYLFLLLFRRFYWTMDFFSALLTLFMYCLPLILDFLKFPCDRGLKK